MRYTICKIECFYSIYTKSNVDMHEFRFLSVSLDNIMLDVQMCPVEFRKSK